MEFGIYHHNYNGDCDELPTGPGWPCQSGDKQVWWWAANRNSPTGRRRVPSAPAVPRGAGWPFVGPARLSCVHTSAVLLWLCWFFAGKALTEKEMLLQTKTPKLGAPAQARPGGHCCCGGCTPRLEKPSHLRPRASAGPWQSLVPPSDKEAEDRGGTACGARQGPPQTAGKWPPAPSGGVPGSAGAAACYAAFCNEIIFCPLLNLRKDSLSLRYPCWELYLILKKLWKNKWGKWEINHVTEIHLELLYFSQ